MGFDFGLGRRVKDALVKVENPNERGEVENSKRAQKRVGREGRRGEERGKGSRRSAEEEKVGGEKEGEASRFDDDGPREGGRVVVEEYPVGVEGENDEEGRTTGERLKGRDKKKKSVSE